MPTSTANLPLTKVLLSNQLSTIDSFDDTWPNLGISGRNCDQCARGYRQYHPLSPVSISRQFQYFPYKDRS